MYSDLGDAVNRLFMIMAVIIIIFAPLGIWKFVEIVRHIHIVWGS